jgi:hypothetical protein
MSQRALSDPWNAPARTQEDVLGMLSSLSPSSSRVVQGNGYG